MADLSTRDLWLQYVNQQLAEDHGVEHLKLALYTDILPSALDALKTPADVFHAIAEGDEQLALAKFHCALESLGRQLRGKLCIRNAKELYRFELPSPLPPDKQTKEFQFFLCLTKISKTLRNHRPGDQNGEEELIRKFSSKQFLKTYHSNIHGIPDLFVRTHRARIITPDNTEELKKFLSSHKRYKKALEYLHQYHGSVFPPSPGDKEITSMYNIAALNFEKCSILYITINFSLLTEDKPVSTSATSDTSDCTSLTVHMSNMHMYYFECG